MPNTSELELLARLLIAAVLGGIIGAERERLNRGAGLRTHALVSTASALAIIVSAYGFMSVLAPGKIVLDPSRVAAQVISGVGFLGAGIIIFRKNAVRGLTTAASIWAVAAVGLAAGAGLYISAVGATVILSFILIVLKKFEKKLFPQREISRINIEMSNSPGLINRVSDQLKANKLKILNLTVKQLPGQNKTVMKVETSGKEDALSHVLDKIQSLPGIESVSYTGRALSFAESEEADEAQGFET
ncbi:MAG TPA: MgtC/SapB family protein [Candidatus Obscuribacterales bacterium]